MGYGDEDTAVSNLSLKHHQAVLRRYVHDAARAQTKFTYAARKKVEEHKLSLRNQPKKKWETEELKKTVSRVIICTRCYAAITLLFVAGWCS